MPFLMQIMMDEEPTPNELFKIRYNCRVTSKNLCSDNSTYFFPGHTLFVTLRTDCKMKSLIARTNNLIGPSKQNLYITNLCLITQNLFSESDRKTLLELSVILTHLFPMHPFSTPWKENRKNLRGERKGVLGTNGLKLKGVNVTLYL